ncbi:MAG: mechanosensitive ion channel family protein [Gammaproteobacteria bacterium]
MKDKSLRPAISLLRVLAIATTVLVFALLPIITQEAAASQTGDVETSATTPAEIRPVRTDSPRDTLRTFLRLRDSLETALLDYRAERSTQGAKHISLLLAQFRALVDLSQVAQTSRSEMGDGTNAYLLDIFGRVVMPNLDIVPEAGAFEDEGLAQYRIPRTPIRITRIDAGAREGEFLFNARTVHVAPRFYRAIEDLPLRSRLGITSWNTTMPQITGPLIPSAVVLAMPRSLWNLWLDTPIWKVIATILIVLIAALLLVCLHRWLSRIEPDTRIGFLSWRLIRPVSIIGVVGLLPPFIDKQINTSGVFSNLVDTTTTVLLYFSAAWLFWLAVRLLFEWVILSPRIGDESLDANLLRLIAGTVGTVGVIVILAYGGQALGLPVLSLLAGLGIGGLAIALAIKPTLENLIGGVVLYVDKPVRVGDFCSFGTQMATVESIGIRSIQLRALDRTLITVPNAQFVDLELVNWEKCDELMIKEKIGVRYETTPDQLRYALAKLRVMLQAHPRLNSKKVRARFSGFGSSSLNITIRVYAQTQEWDEFHAIREDILLRICDVIAEAGTGFAFSSHTLYMGKDNGLDEETGKNAMEQVEAWRRTGQLPFPNPSPEQIKSINDTLDYPPKGSPEASPEDLEAAAGAESLLAEPSSGEQLDEHKENGGRRSEP